MLFIESFLDEIGRSGAFPLCGHARVTTDRGDDQPKRLPVDFPAALFSEHTADAGLS
jgi:hypothetical protein